MQKNESAWRRGWQDTKAALTDWKFWAIEVFGAGTIAIIYNPIAGLIAVAFLAFCAWFKATAYAPIRQRDDERRKHHKTKKKLAQLTKPFEQKSNSGTIGTQNNVNNQIIIQNAGNGKESGESIRATNKVFYIDADVRGGVKINDSKNVSSLTDNGLGDFSINFSTDVDPRLLVVSPVGPTTSFKVMELSKNHVRIKFEGDPDGFKLRIDAPQEIK